MTTTTTKIATTTTTSTTTTTMTTTTTATTTTTTTSTQTPIGTSILSGDIVSLRTLSGAGGMVDVEGSAVQSRWASHGNWQAMSIVKEIGGSVNSGDAVFLRAHT